MYETYTRGFSCTLEKNTGYRSFQRKMRNRNPAASSGNYVWRKERMRRAKKIGIVCVGILMVVFMFLSYSNLFGGETKRDITKISVIGIKRKNSQVEDFKRGIEEAANAKRVDVEYLEIEEDYDTIKEYIDREIKNGSQALIVFSEKKNRFSLICSQKRRKSR